MLGPADGEGGGGEGLGGGAGVGQFFRCDVAHCPVVRPVGGNGTGFYENGSPHRQRDG